MATFEESVDKAIEVAVERAVTQALSQAKSYTDTKIGALPRIPRNYETNMVALGFTKASKVSPKDFLQALYNKGYKVGDVITFSYLDAGAAIVTDGTNSININCVDVFVGTLGDLTHAWQRASVLVVGTGYQGKCARIGASTGGTAGTLNASGVQNL